MNKNPIQLTEADLHNIVEDVVSNMANGPSIGQQQQNNNQPSGQQTAFQQALVKQINFLAQKMGEMYQVQNKMREQLVQQNQFISKQIQQLRDVVYTRR